MDFEILGNYHSRSAREPATEKQGKADATPDVPALASLHRVQRSKHLPQLLQHALNGVKSTSRPARRPSQDFLKDIEFAAFDKPRHRLEVVFLNMRHVKWSTSTTEQ